MGKIRANNTTSRQGGRPAVADHVRQQDQGADLHGLPVDRRADGRALPDARLSPDRHEPQVDHVHQRDPRRLARSGDVEPLVRLPPALRRQGGADHPLRGRQGRGGPVIYQAAMGIAGVTLPPRPDPGAADLRERARGVREAPSGPDPVRQRRGRLVAGPAAARASSSRSPELPHPGHDGPLVVPRGRRRARRLGPGPGRRRLVHLERQGPAADQLHRQHRRGRGRPVDRDPALQVAAAPPAARCRT